MKIAGIGMGLKGQKGQKAIAESMEFDRKTLKQRFSKTHNR